VGVGPRRDAGKVFVARKMAGGTERLGDALMCTVFQISTALGSRLRQLALFMISS